jgi:PAS domain S-box-containing protein
VATDRARALQLLARQASALLQALKRERAEGGAAAALSSASAELQDRDLRFRTLFEGMAEGVVLQDENGNVVSSNQAANRILQTSSLDLQKRNALGPPLTPLVHRDGRPMSDDERPAAIALRTRTTVTNCVMGMRRVDHTVWLSVNATPVHSSTAERLRGVIVTFRDITEQVVLQEALERSLQQFRSLISTLPVGVAVSHGKTMRYVNDALARLLGYEQPSELEGRETLSVVHPRSEADIQARYADMAAGAHPGPGILECVKRDGSSVLVEVTSIPTVYENKPAILALVRDVTENARAREAQERSEARFRALVGFAPVGIFETDLAGRCIYANARLCEMTGLSSSEMLGHGWLQAVHPDDLATIQAKRAEARAAGIGFSHELRFVKTSGVVHAQVQSLALHSDGKVTGYLGALVDVSELRAANAALVTSLGEKETLLKEVHHRVKNNLQVIASLLRLGRGYVTDSAALSIFNDSIARVHAIAGVHEQLYQARDLSRIEMASYLEGLVRELVRANSTQARVSAQVIAQTLRFDVDRCVPIGLIVSELTTNALKHAFKQPRTVPPVIVVALSEREEGYELCVRDNGDGLGDRSLDGSLGLRIVSNLVKQLRGEHRIESGDGTAWYISFPKATLEAEESADR